MTFPKKWLRRSFLLFGFVLSAVTFQNFSDGPAVDSQVVNAKDLPSVSISKGVTATLYYATDTSVSGCAYDPSDPSAQVQVHVYSEANQRPIIGLAAYGCPWSSDARFHGHGFQIQYRRPLNSSAGVNVAFLNARKTTATWVAASQAVHQNISFHRDTQTAFFDTPNYGIGFSLKYGAAVSEYYNNRVDSTVNLVMSDPGAMIQTAYFGATSGPAFSGTNCVGGTDDRYNPTQSGSACSDGNGGQQGASISNCTSSKGNALCGAIHTTLTMNDKSPDWVQYLVHYRNFYNPPGTAGYLNYEDVYGYVKYTFTTVYVAVDVKSWRIGSADYGTTFQQMPVAFLTQISKITTAAMQIERNAGETRDIPQSKSTTFKAGSSHWVLAEAIDNRPLVPISTPGNFLSLAFYGALIKNSVSSCPTRRYQADFLGPAATDLNWLSEQHSAVVQNAFTGIAMEPGIYYQSRALLSTFRPSENVGAGTLGTLMDTRASQGGYVPDWECNQPPISVATPTPTPTPTPVAKPTPTPTPTPTPVAKPTPTPVVKPTPTPTPKPTPTPAPKPMATFTRNVYRFYQSRSHEHFFSKSSSEGTAAGMSAEGAKFQVSAQQVSGTIPLYSCWIKDFKHFVSTDSKCEGQIVVSIYGYIYRNSVAGSRPLYRFYQSTVQDHMVTTNAAEGTRNGYTMIGILGYVH